MDIKTLWSYFVSCITVNYKNFDGRARRSEYWGFVLFNVIISGVIGFVIGFIAGAIGIPALANLAQLYTLATFIPAVAAGVRRMHDIGRRGWWIIVPFVNFYFAILDSEPGDNQYGPNPKGL